eukprot:PhM_4_TR16502/c0_g1_i2/m.41644
MTLRRRYELPPPNHRAAGAGDVSSATSSDTSVVGEEAKGKALGSSSLPSEYDTTKPFATFELLVFVFVLWMCVYFALLRNRRNQIRLRIMLSKLLGGGRVTLKRFHSGGRMHDSENDETGDVPTAIVATRGSTTTATTTSAGAKPYPPQRDNRYSAQQLDLLQYFANAYPHVDGPVLVTVLQNVEWNAAEAHKFLASAAGPAVDLEARTDGIAHDAAFMSVARQFPDCEPSVVWGVLESTQFDEDLTVRYLRQMIA